VSSANPPAFEHFYVPGGSGRWGCGCGARGRAAKGAGGESAGYDSHIHRVLKAARSVADSPERAT
jgi:hypothetical protein